jgi:molybdopterin/thiamine biosynthesis adenylyltransferase
MNLTDEQIERYSRHIILSEVGGVGQEKLLASKVLLVGAGGLGSPIGLYLAAAGIGTIGVIDGDVVDMTNLQRQVLHSTADLGRPKVESAKDTMTGINPDVEVRTYHELLMADNAWDIIKDYDFVIDGLDNFAGKFLLADACHMAGKAYSHAGILRFDGQTMTVDPGKSACYRCIFNAPPPAGSGPTCSQAGVLGVLPGVIGSIQATEAVKYLLGIGDCLLDRLLVYNALTMTFRNVNLKKNDSCPLCGKNPTITELKDAEQAVCDLK